MPRRAGEQQKQTTRVTIEFDNGDTMWVDVKNSPFTTEAARLFKQAYRNIQIHAVRSESIAKELLSPDLASDVYAKLKAELDGLSSQPDEFDFVLDTIQSTYVDWEYYWTKEDEDAGRRIPITREELLKCDPNELIAIVTMVSEKLAAETPDIKKSQASSQPT